MEVRAYQARSVLDADDVRRSLARIAHEIVEKEPDVAALRIVGIFTRGVPIAQRLAALVGEIAGVEVPVGALDIAFYRDDLAHRSASDQPVLHATRLDFPIDGCCVVLVDDVLFTGRTIRAAIDALFDYGRPSSIRLAVLADRGHRELPIRADFVGKNLPTSLDERVNVLLQEIDGEDAVRIVGGDR